ncbi:MAG TPA: Gfo/Idh/MocA family oxidoreductase [Firmicutes bacterium]|nr:Gfo/Idh/MocA family oxidoreductase [Bacillota bacterium]
MRIGTVGTGSIVELFLQAVSEIEDISCAAVYSRSEARGRRLAAKFGVTKVYTDFGQMLADDGVNWIYIASPNSLHYEQARRSLEMGKHVICEKPFTSTSAEAADLMDRAEKRGLFLFEAITTIHLPNFELIKGKIGELGRIRIVQANYSQYSARYDRVLAGEQPNVFNPAFSGGTLVDLNIYNLHFIMGLFGEPLQCKYYANKLENGIDTSGSLILQYPGFVASAVGSKDTWGESFVAVQGERGYLYVNQGANGCRSFYIKINGGPAREYNVQGAVEHHDLLRYELLAFKEIYKQGDQKAYRRLSEHTCSVLKTLEKARHSAGIKYPAYDPG